MRPWILCLTMMTVLSAIATATTPAAAQSLRYKEKLHYVGMSCARVQKDSIAYPANEIFIHATLVSRKTGQAIGIPLPSRNRPYTGVTAGFKTRAGARALWQGEPQDVGLQVVMFEHDDGAPTAELASDILLNLAMAVYGPNAPSDGEATRVREVEGGDRFLRGLDRALGTGNDPMGTARVNLRASEWSRAPLKETGGFRYHFATRHTKNGADCRAYFRFTQGDTYRVARQERPTRPAPAGPDYSAEPEYAQPDQGYPPQDLPPEEDPYLDEGLTEPAPPPPPIEPPPAYNYGYRVAIENLCREPISVAYAYLDENGAWTKRGWRNIGARKTERLDHYVGASELAIHSTIGALRGQDWSGRRTNLSVDNTAFNAPMDAGLSGDGMREVPFQIAEWRANDFKPVVRIDYCGSVRWGKWTAPVKKSEPVAEPRPVILQVNPEPEPKQPRVITVEPRPKSDETLPPAACTDTSGMSEETLERVQQMAARGMLKLCSDR